MKKITLASVLAVLCLYTVAQENIKQAIIKPLQIGDTMPGINIQNVANHYAPTISMAALRGRPVIIDFWGGRCVPCVATLHLLDSLRSASGNAFEVITVSDFATAVALQQALRRYPALQKLQLPVVLGNERLKNYFPHKIISHLVWIGANGVVQAITDGDQITPAHIKAFVAGTPLHLPLKADALEFNLHTPLLQYNSSVQSAPAQMFYSAFFTHLEGVNTANWYPVKDTVNGTQTISAFNQPLLDYCRLVWADGNSVVGANIVLNVKDSARFVQPAGQTSLAWRRQYTYCYTIRIPLSIKETERMQLIREDVAQWLRRMGIRIQQLNEGAQPKYLVTDL
ncbi:MAG: hypothetical protein J7599_21755 [Niabella sp.]|nr:hypothetical protein [Niabella sp.]